MSKGWRGEEGQRVKGEAAGGWARAGRGVSVRCAAPTERSGQLTWTSSSSALCWTERWEDERAVRPALQRRCPDANLSRTFSLGSLRRALAVAWID